MRAGLAAAAERCGVASWFGDGEPPPARGILVANLFAAGLHGCAEMLAAARGEGAGIAYGHDAETQSGVEIGPVLWLARPVDAPTAVARVRAVVPGKAGGIVIISSQLRELAPMREALSSAGVSSSVACDSRQAVDLLEIVRRPDAILIDLGLDAGQGVTIAAHCRGQSEVRDIPLLLLLPREPEPERLVAAARRAGALAPFGAAEVARMLTAALSR
jgi:CheY-like chemotaxis protein